MKVANARRGVPPGNTPFGRSENDNDPFPTGLIARDLKASKVGHRARPCLRKRVNGEVNDGEVLINGWTMGVEFAGFGEA